MFNIQVIKKGRKRQLLDKLVAYWNLNETSGTRADSLNRSPLLDNNTVTSAAGIISNGAQFVATNSESLNVASPSLFNFGDTNFSFAAWVYLDSKTGSMQILSKYNSDTVRDYLLQYVTGSDFFRFIVYDGNASVGLVTSSAGVNLSQWYFVVAYHDAINNLVGISVNGSAPLTSATTGSAGNTAGLFYLGSREGGASLQFWDGRIDEVGVWNRLLSQSEINYLYNLGLGKTYPL